ncbi:uncharacterized protein LOC144381662 isoform X3 [Halichoerus grypus]
MGLHTCQEHEARSTLPESSSVSRGLFFISERWWASSFLAGGWKSKSKLSAGLVFPEASQANSPVEKINLTTGMAV